MLKLQLTKKHKTETVPTYGGTKTLEQTYNYNFNIYREDGKKLSAVLGWNRLRLDDIHGLEWGFSDIKALLDFLGVEYEYEELVME